MILIQNNFTKPYITVLILLVLCVAKTTYAKPNVPPRGVLTGFDMLKALEYCDTHPLDDIEGIWDYADEGFSCLIMADDDVARPDGYNIVVLESEDARLRPGIIIGHIYPTPDPSIFDIWMYTTFKNTSVCSPQECMAKLNADKQGLTLMKRRLKFRFSLSHIALLPWFWRMARVNVEDPVRDIPRGFVKVCPSSVNNRSRKTRYL